MYGTGEKSRGCLLGMCDEVEQNGKLIELESWTNEKPTE